MASGPGPAAPLVNNAAIYPATPFLDTGVQEYDDVQAVSQRGYWLCAQSAARQMQAAGPGRPASGSDAVSPGPRTRPARVSKSTVDG